MKKEAQGYSEKVINGALGEVAQFEKLLPEYLAAKEVTRNRLYLETMERVYGNTSKVMIDSSSSGNLLYLPLDKLISPSEQTGKPKSSTSSGSYGIELEKVETAPASTSPRSDSGRQGRY